MNDTARLLELIDARFGGKQAAFARAIERQPAQINQYLKGRRQLGIEVKMHIEQTLGIPGWFTGQNPSATPAVVMHFPASTIESVMEKLSHYLAQVPQADRGSSSAALAALALNPEDHARKAALLKLLIEPTHETPIDKAYALK